MAARRSAQLAVDPGPFQGAQDHPQGSCYEPGTRSAFLIRRRSTRHSPGRKVPLWVPFGRGSREAQRGEVTCPRPHSWVMVELGWRTSAPDRSSVPSVGSPAWTAPWSEAGGLLPEVFTPVSTYQYVWEQGGSPLSSLSSFPPSWVIKVAQFHRRKDEVGRSPPYSQGAATSATEEVALPLSPQQTGASAGRAGTVGPSAAFHKQMCLCWGAAPWPRGLLSPVPPNLVWLIGPFSSAPARILGRQRCNRIFLLGLHSFACSRPRPPSSGAPAGRPGSAVGFVTTTDSAPQLLGPTFWRQTDCE
ncbi:uncharacterized protein [Callorhinus ursinus]|uniref:Uncharacterized protein LOC112809939 n=1 Tax=Callorhinus ursinus TaxID=34884 RepID=A0A3Q7P0L2_CALUR|nr:uncharacterized protein LOC112809939 [Callorhinus ursinus]